MRTSETLLLDFIRQSPQFRIPVNQRRYAWTRRHCRQLWDDILDAGERQDVREHFLGPIMFVAAVDPLNAHWAPFMVYDGQQRLTTITLILKTLSRHLKDHTAPEGFGPDQIGSEYLVNPFGKGDQHYRLVLKAGDAETLLALTLDMIGAGAANHGEKSTVLLLGRYGHTCPKNMSELEARHPELDLTYMTVHGAKGLEADYVVVLGLRAGKYGFPAEIADDPLIDLVLPAAETLPHAEERRLFHVAMTRARRAVFTTLRRRVLRDLCAMEHPPAFHLRRERGGTMFEVPFS